MESKILIELDFPSGQLVEIELNVTFFASKGYPATHEEPGCPDEICDIEFDEEEAFNLIKENLIETNQTLEFDKKVAVIIIEKELESEEVDISLSDYANQQARDYEYEKAEYFYELNKDAEIERRYNKEE